MDTPPITPIHSSRASLDQSSYSMSSPSLRTPGEAAARLAIDNGILQYPYQQGEYVIRREVGNGRFSTVYEATSQNVAGSSATLNPSRKRNDSVLSPPATPIRTSLDVPNRVFAVKQPLDKSTSKVCRDEARILTLLLYIEGHERYTVPFHGLDARNNAIIMDLMPCSLDGFIKDQLNILSLESRTDIVAASFHHTASYLLEGLRWLHSHGIVHGDIKPGNILLRPSTSQSSPSEMCYDPIYTDFSSTIFLEERPSSPREAPIAGGTWDFMYFGHIKSSRESREVVSDCYTLMMTLMYYVVGESVYRSIPNRWLQMDARKQGRPLEFMRRDVELTQRFEALQARTGFEYLDFGFQKAFNGDWDAVLG